MSNVVLAFAPICLGLAGCAVAIPNGSSCDVPQVYEISPAAATADHSAASPSNKQQFTAGAVYTSPLPTGCAIPAVLSAPFLTVWTTSDPLNTSISSAQDATNGTATCLSSTSGAVTITAKTFRYVDSLGYGDADVQIGWLRA